MTRQRLVAVFEDRDRMAQMRHLRKLGYQVAQRPDGSVLASQTQPGYLPHYFWSGER